VKPVKEWHAANLPVIGYLNVFSFWLHVGPFLFVIVLSLRGLVVASDYPFSIFKHLLIF
jgi:hypothetical protein